MILWELFSQKLLQFEVPNPTLIMKGRKEEEEPANETNDKRSDR